MTKEERNQEISRIKEFAKRENIPIMQDDGIEFLTSFIEQKDHYIDSRKTKKRFNKSLS